MVRGPWCNGNYNGNGIVHGPGSTDNYIDPYNGF
jgi:hypothetical protein